MIKSPLQSVDSITMNKSDMKKLLRTILEDLRDPTLDSEELRLYWIVRLAIAIER
jgi:hypothetical protein